MSLHLIFEHVDGDLSAYLERCPAPGLPLHKIKVGSCFLASFIRSFINLLAFPEHVVANLERGGLPPQPPDSAQVSSLQYI